MEHPGEFKTVKLASARYLDDLPVKETKADMQSERRWEKIIKMTQKRGIGARLAGNILPGCSGHPVTGMGLATDWDRGELFYWLAGLGKITKEGVFLEELEI